MTIQQFILKAIEGGWKYKGDLKSETFLREHGIKIYMNDPDDIKYTFCFDELDWLFLDPKAWQAVGKVEGWYSSVDDVLDTTWESQMHRMIDALCEDKSLEEFIATL